MSSYKPRLAVHQPEARGHSFRRISPDIGRPPLVRFQQHTRRGKYIKLYV